MNRWTGALIRKERLRKNYSQQGLCQGICAVSYLSKIEQGKVEAHEDILIPLLERLNLQYENDPCFLKRAESRINQLYQLHYSGGSMLAEFDSVYAEMIKEQERYLACEYALDVLLFQAYYQDQQSEVIQTLRPWMNQRQLELYLLIHLREQSENQENLLKLNSCALHLLKIGELTLWSGDYDEAITLFLRGYEAACQQADVVLMMYCKLYLGNCYSSTGHDGLMQSNYNLAKKLAKTCDQRTLLQEIDYNIAASWLDWGKIEPAYELLKQCDPKSMLVHHKMALCLEKMQRIEEAKQELMLAEACQKNSEAKELLLSPLRFRLEHPDYLNTEEYAEIMTASFNGICNLMIDGFKRFHIPYMLEVLKKQRKYKEALALIERFS